MNDRILLILKYKNISAAKFADEIDVQRSSVSHILSERNKPSLEFIQKVLKIYPEISPEWLISGKGAMLKNPELFSDNTLTQEIDNKSSEIKKDIVKEKIINSEKNMIDKEPEANIIPEKKQKFKQIEKIIVFYTDKSFSEYNPEN